MYSPLETVIPSVRRRLLWADMICHMFASSLDIEALPLGTVSLLILHSYRCFSCFCSLFPILRLIILLRFFLFLVVDSWVLFCPIPRRDFVVLPPSIVMTDCLCGYFFHWYQRKALCCSTSHDSCTEGSTQKQGERGKTRSDRVWLLLQVNHTYRYMWREWSKMDGREGAEERAEPGVETCWPKKQKDQVPEERKQKHWNLSIEMPHTTSTCCKETRIGTEEGASWSRGKEERGKAAAAAEEEEVENRARRSVYVQCSMS